MSASVPTDLQVTARYAVSKAPSLHHSQALQLPANLGLACSPSRFLAVVGACILQAPGLASH